MRNNLDLAPESAAMLDAERRLCVECGIRLLKAPSETNRQWLARKVCPACECVVTRRRIEAAVSVSPRGCWLWGRSKKNGYGQLSIRDRSVYVHHLAYELYRGPIPDGLEVLHKCDVKECCNPDHLFLGTQLDNIKDMRSKGRGKNPPIKFGFDHHSATLTDEQVAELRSLVSRGRPQREVAAFFGVSQSTVWRLAHGYTRSN